MKAIKFLGLTLGIASAIGLASLVLTGCFYVFLKIVEWATGSLDSVRLIAVIGITLLVAAKLAWERVYGRR